MIKDRKMKTCLSKMKMDQNNEKKTDFVKKSKWIEKNENNLNKKRKWIEKMKTVFLMKMDRINEKQCKNENGSKKLFSFFGCFGVGCPPPAGTPYLTSQGQASKR